MNFVENQGEKPRIFEKEAIFFVTKIPKPYFCRGEMAERSNAAVLKTVDCYRSGGSNPSLSAELSAR